MSPPQDTTSTSIPRLRQRQRIISVSQKRQRQSRREVPRRDVQPLLPHTSEGHAQHREIQAQAYLHPWGDEKPWECSAYQDKGQGYEGGVCCCFASCGGLIVRRGLGVFFYRSSRGLNVLLERCLRTGNCIASLFSSKRTNCGNFAGNGCSLYMLSIVVPGGSNFALTRRVHSVGPSVPIVFLATGAVGRSVLRNFGVNTSSCLAGPFDVRRLLLHVRTVLHHIGNGGVGSVPFCGLKGFLFSARGRALTVNSGIAGLAAGRYRLLDLLYTRTGRVLRHGCTLGAV